MSLWTLSANEKPSPPLPLLVTAFSYLRETGEGAASTITEG